MIIKVVGSIRRGGLPPLLRKYLMQSVGFF